MTDGWSIADGYWDSAGGWHDTSPDTRAALRRAMGASGDEAGADDGPPSFVGPWCVRAGSTPRLLSRADLVLEDGTAVPAVDALPADLPPGYHQLLPHDGGPTTALIVSPGACPRPAQGWGWQVQLYAVRSARSWGQGDLGDLARLSRWSSTRGASITLINPLHASLPLRHQQDSPYFSSSRVFRSVLFLDVERIAAAGERLGSARLDELARAGRELNGARRIDRDAVYALKRGALWELYRAAPDDARFEQYRQKQGSLLARFATFMALAEHHGTGWPAWPPRYRRPESAAVARFARTHADVVRFHAWCQWQLDIQLDAAATAGTRLIGDLAVGFDPGGADAWMWQDDLALDCRVGAPPDDFNAGGQDWGLPPFIPWRMRYRNYEMFVATVRAAFAHMGGLRIDHVMGLFRLYWIPRGAEPADGTYVSYPAADLLDIVALEATRAGAFAVGEDLGTVQDEVRDELAERCVLSTRLVWFETEPPAEFPELALASVTTHDLPTLAGVWTGADLANQRAMGQAGSDEAETWFRSRITNATGLADDAALAEVIVATHRALARAPSLLVTAALDDALGVSERPNFPGTTDEWPNWCNALPLSLEAIERDRVVGAIAEEFARSRPSIQ